jgi:HD-GYP domain-containing protein (c-di-GMP phosphodiesterase class II)
LRPLTLAAPALLAAAISFLSAGCSIQPPVSASAARGETDLSSGVAFEKGGLARLDGEWDFYPGVLMSPEELSRSTLPAPARTKVPGVWAAANGFENPSVPPTGVGTLRLRAKVPAGRQEWALRIPNADSATRVFVNGSPAAEIGSVSETPEFSLPSNGIALPRFRAAGGYLDIVMQVSNFSMPRIGTWDSPILGYSSAVLLKRQVDIETTSLVSGALLIMGFYHLGLFLLRKKDRASLLFGIACLLMTVRNMIMGERLLLDLFGQSAETWAWAYKVEHLSAHMTVPLFALFFGQLFPRQVHRTAVGIVVAVGCLWAAVVLLLPPMHYQRFLHWYELFILVASAYMLFAIVTAAVKKEVGAIVVLAGIAMLIGTSANDVLLSLGVITKTFYMASIGVFLYAFAQSFHLSMIFSKAFSHVEELSDSLLNKNSELESLHTIDLAIASSEDRDKVLDVILGQAIMRLGVDAADILLLDEPEGHLSLGARVGFRTDALLHTKLNPGQGFAGRAMQSGSVVYSDLDANVEGFRRSPAFAEESFFFYAGCRLMVKGKIVGVLELYRRSPFRPYQSWEMYFKTIAGQAAVALDNSSLLQGLKSANEELLAANEATIEGWAEALELRDRETEGHSRRVTGMTVELARRFGISGIELDRVRRGALLHDIGKMGIPDSILLKPGKLTDEEFEVMKRHPEIARNLLSRMRFLDGALDIPYCHHEKWDGGGYPRGISGTVIPLPARLFSIVDVWDALRSDRPYRKSWPEEQVLEHIVSLSGSHFDPEAIDAFIEMRRDSKTGLDFETLIK